jgi:hypothetical protein
MRIVLIVLLAVAAVDEWKSGHKNEAILLSYVSGKNEKRASGSSTLVVFRVKKLM